MTVLKLIEKKEFELNHLLKKSKADNYVKKMTGTKRREFSLGPIIQAGVKGECFHMTEKEKIRAGMIELHKHDKRRGVWRVKGEHSTYVTSTMLLSYL